MHKTHPEFAKSLKQTEKSNSTKALSTKDGEARYLHAWDTYQASIFCDSLITWASSAPNCHLEQLFEDDKGGEYSRKSMGGM
jgi:hypothetical protein